jgi:hypothetical protein
MDARKNNRHVDFMVTSGMSGKSHNMPNACAGGMVSRDAVCKANRHRAAEPPFN